MNNDPVKLYRERFYNLLKAIAKLFNKKECDCGGAHHERDNH